MYDPGFYGFATRSDKLLIARDLPLNEIRYTVAHECIHIIDHHVKFDNREMFGKAPFVTEYAKNNGLEDMAETGAAVFTGKSIPRQAWKKVKYVKRLLSITP